MIGVTCAGLPHALSTLPISDGLALVGSGTCVVSLSVLGTNFGLFLATVDGFWIGVLVKMTFEPFTVAGGSLEVGLVSEGDFFKGVAVNSLDVWGPFESRRYFCEP